MKWAVGLSEALSGGRLCHLSEFEMSHFSVLLYFTCTCTSLDITVRVWQESMLFVTVSFYVLLLLFGPYKSLVKFHLAGNLSRKGKKNFATFLSKVGQGSRQFSLTGGKVAKISNWKNFVDHRQKMWVTLLKRKS